MTIAKLVDRYYSLVATVPISGRPDEIVWFGRRFTRYDMTQTVGEQSGEEVYREKWRRPEQA